MKYYLNRWPGLVNVAKMFDGHRILFLYFVFWPQGLSEVVPDLPGVLGVVVQGVEVLPQTLPALMGEYSSRKSLSLLDWDFENEEEMTGDK